MVTPPHVSNRRSGAVVWGHNPKVPGAKLLNVIHILFFIKFHVF